MNIIQVGSNRGTDHVLDFVKSNLEKIKNIKLIDAFPWCVEQTKKAYEGIESARFLNFCITTKEDGIETFYAPEIIEFCDVASLRLEHVRKHLEGHNIKIIEHKIPSKNINTLLREDGFEEIERLYLDCEGLDCELILSIDFSKVNIKFIQYESHHSESAYIRGEKELLSMAKLIENGYKVKYYPDINNITAILNKYNWQDFGISD